MADIGGPAVPAKDASAVVGAAVALLEGFLAAQDTVALVPGSMARAADVLDELRRWCATAGVPAPSAGAVGRALRALGVEPHRTKDARWYRGMEVRPRA